MEGKEGWMEGRKEGRKKERKEERKRKKGRKKSDMHMYGMLISSIGTIVEYAIATVFYILSYFICLYLYSY